MNDAHPMRSTAFHTIIAIDVAMVVLIVANLFEREYATSAIALLVLVVAGAATYLLRRWGYVARAMEGGWSWRALEYPFYFAGMFAYRYFFSGNHDPLRSLIFASIATTLYVIVMAAPGLRTRTARSTGPASAETK